MLAIQGVTINNLQLIKTSLAYWNTETYKKGKLTKTKTITDSKQSQVYDYIDETLRLYYLGKWA